MKKLSILSIIAALVLACSTSANAFDLKGAINKVKEKTSQTGTTGDGSSSGLGSLLGNLLSSDKIELSSMVGDWAYSAPAVKFRSDNLLQKAGGAAATSVIEGKLAPYYKTAGIDKMTLTINADSTFTMKVRGISINGTIEPVTDKDNDANFVFCFKAVKKINMGKLNTYITKSATGQMDITFDVTKLLELLQKISSVTGSKSLSAASKLLSSYDGVCAGFRVTAQNQQ